MTYNLSTPDDIALRLPITSDALEVAQRFSQSQPPATRKRIILNTLAVYTVHNYLELMGFPTDLQAGDSWNPIASMCMDVADLAVTGIGKLECRPVTLADREYPIPPEVWLDRIGYTFVHLDLETRTATIQGFTPYAKATISPARLQSPEELIDRLHSLMAKPLVKLDRWLQETIEGVWQTVESLFPTAEFAFRAVPSNAIRRAKMLDLGIQLQGNKVALVVELTPDLTTERTHIRLQVHPLDRLSLPPYLQLSVIDDEDRVVLETTSRAADDTIQLHFSGTGGENFVVSIVLGDARITERFVI
jgi:Protein of unknown function (DUF1822)